MVEEYFKAVHLGSRVCGPLHRKVWYSPHACCHLSDISTFAQLKTENEMKWFSFIETETNTKTNQITETV